MYNSGYTIPRPLINKLAINANIINKHKFIGLTIDLLQQHPELFDQTATTLIYILNINTNYKPEAIYEQFKSMLTTDSILSKASSIEQLGLNSNIENSILNEDFTESNSLLLSFAYYLYRNNVFKDFEPSMTGIKKAFDLFVNNPLISYKGKTHNFNDLHPLAYTINGANILNFIPYFCYVATFFMDGCPYKFYAETGSESIPNRLYTNIDNYFGKFYNRIISDLHINISENAASKWYELFKNENQLASLKNMLNTMLNFENIIRLRNDEMNKSEALLNQCFEDQNRLSDSFLNNSFRLNMDHFIEILIENTPFNKFLSKFPVFEPMLIDAPARKLNINELMRMTSYVLGNQEGYVIINKENNNSQFCPVNYRSLTTYKNFDVDYISEPTLKSNINELNISLKLPFTPVDKIMGMTIAFIKARLQTQQESFFESPDFSSDFSEPIKVESADLTSDLTEKLMNLFVGPWYQSHHSILNNVLKNLPKSNIKFSNDITDILNLSSCFCKFVPEKRAQGLLMTPYIFALLPEKILNHTINISTDLKQFDFLRHVLSGCYSEMIGLKLYDMMISLMFINTDEYSRFVNLSTKDITEYLLNSIIEIPYIKGNSDECDNLAIGGLSLYNVMIDQNPFNRGYEYLLQLYGTNEELEYFHFRTSIFKDSSLISLINSATSKDTIEDILLKYAKTFKNSYVDLNDYSLNSNLIFEQSDRTKFIDLEIISQDSKNKTKIYELILNHCYPNTQGFYINNEFHSIRLENNGYGYVPIEMTINEFKYPNGKNVDKSGKIEQNSTDVTIEKSNTEIYSIPVYKYVGNIEDKYLKFVNPSGYKLLIFHPVDQFGLKNETIFMFTNSKLDTMFNYYEVN